MIGWQMKRKKEKQRKSSFCKNVRECRIITMIVKWLLHFRFVLADRCRVPVITDGSSR